METFLSYAPYNWQRGSPADDCPVCSVLWLFCINRNDMQNLCSKVLLYYKE